MDILHFLIIAAFLCPRHSGDSEPEPCAKEMGWQVRIKLTIPTNFLLPVELPKVSVTFDWYYQSGETPLPPTGHVTANTSSYAIGALVCGRDGFEEAQGIPPNPKL
jgi:hypothetical protein